MVLRHPHFTTVAAMAALLISVKAGSAQAVEANGRPVVAEAAPAVVRYYDPGVPDVQPAPSAKERRYRPRSYQPRANDRYAGPRYRQRYDRGDRWQADRRFSPGWDRGYGGGPYGNDGRPAYGAARDDRGWYRYGYAPPRYDGFADWRREPLDRRPDGRADLQSDWRRDWQPAWRPYWYSNWRGSSRFY